MSNFSIGLDKGCITLKFKKGGKISSSDPTDFILYAILKELKKDKFQEDLKVSYDSLPKEKGIFPPKEGWKENNFYIIEVSIHKQNPIHLSLLYVGFVDKKTGEPSSYTQIFNPTYSNIKNLNNIYYLKPIKNLGPLLGDQYR